MTGDRCELTYYRGEEVVMMDGDYLIRLDQKGADIRLVPKGRGRFALQLGCKIDLVEKA